MRNYSLDEWRDLIKVGQEIVKEKGVEKIQKVSDEDLPSDWKSIGKDLGYAVVDLAASLLNEKFFHQAMAVEKQSGLSEKEKAQRMLPTLTEQMDKISRRVGSSNLSKAEYYRAETKVNKMFKKIFREVKLGMIKKGLGWDDIENLGGKKGKQLLDILGNISTAEIVVVKEKIRSLVDMLVKNYAPAEVKNSPEIKQGINSFLNLVGAVADEKLIKELLELGVKWGRAALRNPELLKGKKTQDKYGIHYEWNFITQFRKAGLDQELKSLVRNLTSHLNKLAGQGEKNDNSPVNREAVIQKLTTSLPDQPDNPNSEENDNQPVNSSVSGLLTNNMIAKGAKNIVKNADGAPEKDWNLENLFQDSQKILTEHQSQGEWYQRTWVIVSLIVGAFLVGGLVVWLFLRKKNQPVKEE